MAERVGFEPTVPLQVHLISNQARSTELRHLSAGAEASRIRPIWATALGQGISSLSPGRGQGGSWDLGRIRRPRALVLACALLKEWGSTGDVSTRRSISPSSTGRGLDRLATLLSAPGLNSEGSIRFGER